MNPGVPLKGNHQLKGLWPRRTFVPAENACFQCQRLVSLETNPKKSRICAANPLKLKYPFCLYVPFFFEGLYHYCKLFLQGPSKWKNCMRFAMILQANCVCNAWRCWHKLHFHFEETRATRHHMPEVRGAQHSCEPQSKPQVKDSEG